MKRVLVVFLVLLLLTGCSRTDSVPAEPENPPAVEENEAVTPEPAPEPAPEVTAEEVTDPGTEDVQEKPPVPKPDPAPEVKPEPAPEPSPEPVPEPTPEPEPEPEPIPAWTAYAMGVYADITGHDEFHVMVWEEDDSRTNLVIQRGVNDWSVDSLASCFTDYEWTQAGSEDWIAMIQQEGYDPQLSFYLPGEISFTCCEDGDIVEIVDQTKITYLRAVPSKTDVSVGNENLYGRLRMVAEDVVSDQVWNVTADGSISPNEAAARMTEKIAEQYRSVPDWVSWKAETVRATRAEVFDVYNGESEEFCFNLDLAVKLADPMAPEAGYWQAGAGLDEPDEDGFYSWGHEVWVQKNATGQWVLSGYGTGGYAVMPQNTENKPQLDWLVEVFCLTEGLTHDWIIPNQILNLELEELAGLPEVLDQLTEAESNHLCQTLGTLLAENDCWILTADDLIPLLGDYAVYLNA